LRSEAVRAKFAKYLDELLEQATGASTRITAAILLEDPPSLDAHEVTDKGSLNQRAVLDHRAALVEALYQGTSPGVIHARAAVSRTG
jgi:feruloyl-CoA synthase